jgi:hypothetical protein
MEHRKFVHSVDHSFHFFSCSVRSLLAVLSRVKKTVCDGIFLERTGRFTDTAFCGKRSVCTKQRFVDIFRMQQYSVFDYREIAEIFIVYPLMSETPVDSITMRCSIHAVSLNFLGRGGA